MRRPIPSPVVRFAVRIVSLSNLFRNKIERLGPATSNHEQPPQNDLEHQLLSLDAGFEFFHTQEPCPSPPWSGDWSSLISTFTCVSHQVPTTSHNALLDDAVAFRKPDNFFGARSLLFLPALRRGALLFGI